LNLALHVVQDGPDFAGMDKVQRAKMLRERLVAVRGYAMPAPKPKKARRYSAPTGGWVGNNAFNFSVGQNVKELPECAWKEKREVRAEAVRPGRGRKVSALTKFMKAYPVRLPRAYR
jgi:hypothetical protein